MRICSNESPLKSKILSGELSSLQQLQSDLPSPPLRLHSLKYVTFGENRSFTPVTGTIYGTCVSCSHSLATCCHIVIGNVWAQEKRITFVPENLELGTEERYSHESSPSKVLKSNSTSVNPRLSKKHLHITMHICLCSHLWMLVFFWKKEKRDIENSFILKTLKTEVSL